MTFVLGLTGSIGMGKSTTARMFADEGIPVWDADATVHRLYQPGEAAALAVARLFPQAMDEDGTVNRPRLRALINADPSVLDRLNAAVHPLVAESRARFLRAQDTADIVLLDVPLLYEIGLDKDCDAVAVVSAPPEVQRERVLMRGMTEAEFRLILSRQLPDAEKRARADYVIPTTGLEGARQAVKDVLADIRRTKDA
ncbi:MAG: dephospho-CoA kinase [Tabrizicola sp.]|jgi:dephospho-CoA kinase|nr:dephospho-CoA kinase [Tabrizicola sp.]